MVEVEPFHALVERMADVVRAMLGVAEFCRDVDLIAGYSGFSQCKSHAHFVSVHLRGVDMAIAYLERETDYISRLARVLGRRCTVRGDLQCTKTQLRDRCSVVEGDCGDHRLALPLQLNVSAPLAPAPQWMKTNGVFSEWCTRHPQRVRDLSLGLQPNCTATEQR